MKNDLLLRIFFLLLLSSASAMAQRPRTNVQPSPTPTTQASIDAKGNLAAQIRGLSRQISNDLTENQKRTIAVVEFADLTGNINNFGRFIAEMLITRLHETRKFTVIERHHLNKVIAEQKLTLTGMIDLTTAQKLGQLLGVDAIATGTVTDLGNTLHINARLVNTTTAAIFAVASLEVLKNDVTETLMRDDSSDLQEDPSRPRDKYKSRKFNAQLFTFELHGCRLAGAMVVCDMTIVNHAKDRSLGICYGGVIFDVAGNQYKMQRARLANDEGWNARAFLLSGIPTGARVTFDQVSPSATKITLLSLNICNIEGGADVRLEYRNVPLRDHTGTEDVRRSSDESDRPRFGQKRTFAVHANQQWMEPGIDVLPGMRLDITAGGRVFITDQNSTTNQITDRLLGGKIPPIPPRSVGTNALLAKILYDSGGESSVVKIGDRKTLTIEDGQSGRLVFGIDERSVNDNSGYFTVTVRW